MPTYTWQCEKCEAKSNVFRPISRIDEGPEETCECGSNDFKRIIEAGDNKQFILVHGGRAPWHDESYLPTGKPTGK